MVMLAAALTCHAQSGWQWGAHSTDSIYLVMHMLQSTNDKNGNIFTSGYVCSMGYSTFGSFSVYNPSHYRSKLVITKTDSFGHFIWVKDFLADSSFGQFSTTMATDTAGNIYVFGSYADSLFLGAPYNLSNSTPATLMLFLIRMSPSGSLICAKNVGIGQKSQFNNNMGFAIRS